MSLADDIENEVWAYERHFENEKTNYLELRKSAVWRTKNNGIVAICDMKDGHLFNAWKFGQDERLFHEMVFRLFGQRVETLKE